MHILQQGTCSCTADGLQQTKHAYTQQNIHTHLCFQLLHVPASCCQGLPVQACIRVQLVLQDLMSMLQLLRVCNSSKQQCQADLLLQSNCPANMSRPHDLLAACHGCSC
jgi:hypothetical protein